MSKAFDLVGRGVRYIRKHGVKPLYCKVMERRLQNQLERPYSRWLEEQKPDAKELKRQREKNWNACPKISVLVPAYETPAEFLCQMVDTLLDQTYTNWELCIADGSKSDLVKETLKPYMEQDPRICYEKLSGNLGVAQNTNVALAMATGEWVGLLDHDDILHPQTLFRIREAMEEHPRAEAFYTDEDKVSFDLKLHFQPHFKPDFNREYLRSNNYICHFFVVKRSIALKVGGFSSDFDGAQDHDFILKCTEEAGEVCHIPEILYSWRCHPSSTASNPESKLYAYEAGKRAVAAHLKRVGEVAEVLDTNNYGFYRVSYKRNQKSGNFGVSSILMDSFEKIRGQNGLNVVYYDKACNNIVTFGKKDVTDGYVLFTHVKNFKAVDAKLFAEQFLQELISVCERPDVGIACARVYDRQRRLTSDIRMKGVRNPFGQSTRGLKAGYLGYFHRACLQQEVEAVTGCFLMRAEVLKTVAEALRKSTDAESITIEVDQLVQKVREMNYRVVYDPWAVLYER